MKKMKISTFTLGLAVGLSLIFTISPTPSLGAPKVSLTIDDARIYIPLKGAPATAGYGVMKNTSDKAIEVTISQCDPFKAVEAHETLEKEGRMAMQKVEKFSIPARGQFELKPGGHHLMLFEPTREIKLGEKLLVELKVEGQSLKVPFSVVSRPTSHDDHSGHH